MQLQPIPNEPEEWRLIPGTDDLYEASSLGRIRRSVKPYYRHKLTGALIKPSPNQKGYLQVKLCGVNTAVHRLIAITFISSPPESDSQINHLDGNKANNRPGNLEWTDRSGNIRHGYAMGLIWAPRGQDHPEAKLTDVEVIEIRRLAIGRNQQILAKRFGVSDSAIGHIIRRESWKHLP